MLVYMKQAAQTQLNMCKITLMLGCIHDSTLDEDDNFRYKQGQFCDMSA